MVVAAVNLTTLAAVCGICSFLSAGLIGLIFRGAAGAWKTERDAAVEKADRLEDTVNEQATEIGTLKTRVLELEKKTDYDVYAERSARDHKAILDAVSEQTRRLHANTVAVEFLIKQAFPAASIAFPVSGAADSSDERGTT